MPPLSFEYALHESLSLPWDTSVLRPAVVHVIVICGLNAAPCERRGAAGSWLEVMFPKVSRECAFRKTVSGYASWRQEWVNGGVRR